MVDKIVQCSIKKADGRTAKQRIYVTNGDNVEMQVGVWKKNVFTNELTITFSKDELLEILNDGK